MVCKLVFSKVKEIIEADPQATESVVTSTIMAVCDTFGLFAQVCKDVMSGVAVIVGQEITKGSTADIACAVLQQCSLM